jgi:O-antigen/teichoic acid export membrane protein
MTGKSKTIVANSTMLMGADVLSKIIRIVLVIYSARLLGDESYGKFGFALSFTTLFLILTDLGIHQLLVRELARKPDKLKLYIGNVLAIKLFLSALYFLFIFIVIRFSNKPHDVLVTVGILAAYQILNSFSLLFRAVFQAFQQMKYDAISTLLQTILDTILGISILIIGGNYQALAYMYLLASFLNIIYCLTVIIKKFTKLTLIVDFSIIKYLLREGLPFGILFFFAMMYNYMGSVILSFLTNDEIVGWYKAANNLIFAMLFIPTGTMKAVFPVLSKYFKTSMEEFALLFEKTFKMMLFIGISIALLVSLLSDKIILFLYGIEYIRAAEVLQILIWSTALIFMTTVMTHATRSADRQRFTAKVVGFGALLNLILNLILIPKYGFIGAALTTVATEGSTFVFHLFYCWKNLVKPPVLKYAPKVILINLIMGVFIMLFRDLNLFIVVIIAVCINCLMVRITHFLTQKEYTLIKDMLRLSKSEKKESSSGY